MRQGLLVAVAVGVMALVGCTKGTGSGGSAVKSGNGVESRSTVETTTRSKATLRVTVTGPDGTTPIVAATVVIKGSHLRATTNSAGVARLNGLASGSYEVRASKRGYYAHDQEITIEAQRRSTPFEITLVYAPPIGSWVSHAEGGYGTRYPIWEILTVSSTYPFRASLRVYTWDCRSGRWDAQTGSATWNPDDSADDTRFNPLQVTGPFQVATANNTTADWLPAQAATLPRFRSNALPSGAAC